MNEDRPPYDLHFRPIAEAVQEFATAHSLLLDKYIKHWSLNFSHPLGGHANVQVWHESADDVLIQGHWWIDDLDRFTRSGKSTAAAKAPKNVDRVKDELERRLHEVLAWRFGEWDDVVTGYESIWKPLLEHRRKAPPWPTPKP